MAFVRLLRCATVNKLKLEQIRTESLALGPNYKMSRESCSDLKNEEVVGELT